MGPTSTEAAGASATGLPERFEACALERFAEALLVRAGASEAAAAVTAEAMLWADRRGISTHGVVYLGVYVPRLASGAISGSALPEVVAEREALGVFDGHFAPGALVARAAMRWCCERAGTTGVAAALVRDSTHFGAASFYAALAAARGCVGIVLSNSDPGLAPLGSLAPLLGTNPIAVAAPSGRVDEPVVLDMATSVVAAGRLSAAARAGEQIPLGWAIGPDGAPTTDPALGLANAVLPLGGHKGFALAFAVEVLTSCLAGGVASPSLAEEHGASHAFVAIDAAVATGFAARVDGLVEAVHEAPRAPGEDRLVFPGERELRLAAGRAEQVPLAAATVEMLRALGDAHGLALPSPTPGSGAR